MLASMRWDSDTLFYLPVDPLKWFIVCLFFLGLGGANFRDVYVVVRSSIRRSAGEARLHLRLRWGDLRGPGFTFLVGAGVAH